MSTKHKPSIRKASKRKATEDFSEEKVSKRKPTGKETSEMTEDVNEEKSKRTNARKKTSERTQNLSEDKASKRKPTGRKTSEMTEDVNEEKRSKRTSAGKKTSERTQHLSEDKASKRKPTGKETSEMTDDLREEKVSKRTATKKRTKERTQASNSPKPLSGIKVIKKDTLNLQPCLTDVSNHFFTGIAATEDGRILFSDSMNERVSLFSMQTKLKFLSCVRVPEAPYSTAVIDNTEAAVSTYRKCLVILDITSPELKIKDKIRLPYDITGGLTILKDKLVVTGSAAPAGPEATVGTTVKLIDRSGTIYWSSNHDEQSPRMWLTPESVCSYTYGMSSYVVVSEDYRKTLTLLDGETGNVITRRHLKKGPFGVAPDRAGNVFVCFFHNQEISVFNSDLSEDKVILKAKDGLAEIPRYITINNDAKQLFIVHERSSFCECFELKL